MEGDRLRHLETAETPSLITGSGLPTAEAAQGTFYWDLTNKVLYQNRDGTASGWTGVHGLGARVFNSANISISNDSNTALTFDSERFDAGSFHSTSSNTSRLTVPVSGKYLVVGNAEFAANATGFRTLGIRLNATTIIGASRSTSPGAAGTLLNVAAVYEMAAGAYVELMAYQNSGGSLNILANSAFSPEFMISIL